MIYRFGFPETGIGNSVNDVVAEFNHPMMRHQQPSLDIVENETETVIQVELPGVKKEEVAITFEENVLTVSGERKPYEISPHTQVLVNEMRLREFKRSVRFATDVDSAKITAEMDNGILTVRVPKAEQAKARTIAIN
ncbi:MAG: Hsp20/alpha crystallin family protein [Ignavibacteriales bacterium]|nr:Hsp20/alpha crystallin family protein [Ignavibacteriales bacterium]